MTITILHKSFLETNKILVSLFLIKIYKYESGLIDMIEKYFNIYVFVNNIKKIYSFEKIYDLKLRYANYDNVKIFIPYVLNIDKRKIFKHLRSNLYICGFCELKKNTLSYSNLTSLTISNSNIKLPDRCFRQSNLVSAYINTNIPKSCFSFCFKLKNITLGPKCYTISKNAFLLCFDMKYIYIPNTIKEIKTNTFNDSGLKQIMFQKRTSVLILHFGSLCCDIIHNKVKLPHLIYYKTKGYCSCKNKKCICFKNKKKFLFENNI